MKRWQLIQIVLFRVKTVGLYRPLNIEDQLFRYGARVNPAIVRDIECMNIRLTVMSGGSRQQVVSAPWIYYPLLNPSAESPHYKEPEQS